MSLYSSEGKTQRHDVLRDRTSAGTIGSSHVQPSSIGGRGASRIITPLDSRITYGGTWSISSNNDVNNFLGYRARSSVVASTLSLQFSGTSIAIIGNNGPYYGRFDVYIDGALAYGAVTAATVLAASYYTTGGLNATDTTITVADTTNFSGGLIVIDGEEISYSGKTATTFTGCVRGINGTQAATHQAGTTLYAISSGVEGYTAYYQDRLVVWKKSNLSPGRHTLSLVIRADKHASSGGNDIDIGGFVVGGMFGAQNILTNISYYTLTGTTDANGVLGSVAINPVDTDQQLLAVIGCYPTSGATWAFPMFNPGDGTYSFPTSRTSAGIISAVIVCLRLGPTF